MQKYQKFLTPREIESRELSGFEEIQMKLHGNILRETKRHPIFEELANEEPEAGYNDFQNHIYSLQNPAQ